jgi:hypothetical protein
MMRSAMAAASAAASSHLEGPSFSSNSVGRPWLPGPGGATTKPSISTALQPAHKAAPKLFEDMESFRDESNNDEGGVPGPVFDTEQILMLMVRTFIYNDLLVKARRAKTSGSILSKMRASSERLTPADVWKP